MSTVLLVEDDLALAGALAETLRVAGIDVHCVESAELALQWLQAQDASLVLADVNLAGMSGFDLLVRLQGSARAPAVVLMTAFATIDRAVAAMKQGAVDYLAKPFRARELLDCVRRHLRPAADAGSAAPVAVDARSREVLAQLARVAASRVTVLLEGESGTGKEVFARHLHALSPRAAGPFVAINCAAIPEQMLEAILFGHERGAFTSAHSTTPGKFELADGGTLLLDEISELDIGLQAKLLRVLQEGEVERIGARAPRAVDVRVVATTNRNLRDWTSAGRFREDLYYRLSVFPITISPLRERPGDVLPLARVLLDRHGGAQRSFDDAAAEALCAHDWPGNVRELENVVQRALILAGDAVSIGVAALHLPPAAARPLPAGAAPATAGAAVATSLPDNVELAEQGVILDALRRHEGHRRRAAAELCISERTLRYKLSRLRERGIAI
jgi:two-component system response regulator FlrC